MELVHRQVYSYVSCRVNEYKTHLFINYTSVAGTYNTKCMAWPREIRCSNALVGKAIGCVAAAMCSEIKEMEHNSAAKAKLKIKQKTFFFFQYEVPAFNIIIIPSIFRGNYSYPIQITGTVEHWEPLH